MQEYSVRLLEESCEERRAEDAFEAETMEEYTLRILAECWDTGGEA